MDKVEIFYLKFILFVLGAINGEKELKSSNQTHDWTFFLFFCCSLSFFVYCSIVYHTCKKILNTKWKDATRKKQFQFFVTWNYYISCLPRLNRCLLAKGPEFLLRNQKQKFCATVMTLHSVRLVKYWQQCRQIIFC